VTPTFFQAKTVLQQVSGVWSFGQAGAPTFPNTLPNQPPANVPAGVRDAYVTPTDMQVPMSYQMIGTLDHAFQNDFTTSVSLLYTRSSHKELLFDTNLTFSDAAGRFSSIRPDPSFRRILQYSYSGKVQYTGVVLGARKRVAGRFFFSGDATFARAYDQGRQLQHPGPGSARSTGRVRSRSGHATCPVHVQRFVCDQSRGDGVGCVQEPERVRLLSGGRASFIPRLWVARCAPALVGRRRMRRRCDRQVRQQDRREPDRESFALLPETESGRRR
jgi:hypothetical protein